MLVAPAAVGVSAGLALASRIGGRLPCVAAGFLLGLAAGVFAVVRLLRKALR